MDVRVKELIAVGASVTANCHPCIKYHVAKAREAGAGEAEIKDAVAVGKMVRKGAAGKMDKLLVALVEGGATGEEVKGCGADH